MRGTHSVQTRRGDWQALDIDGDHAVPLLGVRTEERAQKHQGRQVDGV
jgi:hypothetical protein